MTLRMHALLYRLLYDFGVTIRCQTAGVDVRNREEKGLYICIAP